MAFFCLSGCRRQFLRLGISSEAGTRRNSRMRSRISMLGFVDISRAPLVMVWRRVLRPESDFQTDDLLQKPSCSGSGRVRRSAHVGGLSGWIPNGALDILDHYPRRIAHLFLGDRLWYFPTEALPDFAQRRRVALDGQPERGQDNHLLPGAFL